MKKISIIFLILLGSLWAEEKTATFGGGCFWCIEAAFQPVKGVLDAQSGYMGGEASTANYTAVSQGKSGHYEVVQVHYDTQIISYKERLDIFWKNIDPKNFKGKYCDIGSQYMPVIFYQNEKEKIQAEKSKQKKEQSLGKLSVEILPFSTFYIAEEDHQKYYIKKPERYQAYEKGSGRKG